MFPVDFTQGPVIRSDAARTPYAFSGRGGFQFGTGEGGTLRSGPEILVRYVNPGWRARAGVNAGIKLKSLLGYRYGVILHGAAHLGTAPPAYSAGLVADIPIVRLSGWLVRDLATQETSFELGLGAELRALAATLGW